MESLRKEPSLSENSCIIISTPDHHHHQRQEAKQSSCSTDHLQLDLKLTTTQELNLLDSLNTAAAAAAAAGSSDSSTEPETPQPTDAEQRVFSCNYCQRKFYSSQALGGHQNAHKRERTLAKRGQRMGAHLAASAAAFGHPYLHHNHYSSLASLPLNGAFNRSLGIQVHSMIHKPSHHHHHHHMYGHHSWSRPPIEQQPAIGKLSSMENSHSHAIGSVGRFNVTRTTTTTTSSQADEVMGNNCWWSGKTKQEEMQKVDLSLKL